MLDVADCASSALFVVGVVFVVAAVVVVVIVVVVVVVVVVEIPCKARTRAHQQSDASPSDMGPKSPAITRTLPPSPSSLSGYNA